MTTVAPASLEVAKFAIYVAVPVAFTFYVVNPDNMLSFLRWKQYVKYPAEEQRKVPTSAAEVRAAYAKLQQQKKLE